MLKSKLTIFLILLSAISYMLFAIPVSAAGLVPCGGPTEKMCTVCDFFVLIQKIINLILLVFASLATLMAVYIAFLFMISGGSPQKITDAKGKLWLLVIGIFWVLGSWLVLNTILNFVVNKSVFPLPWNKINCEVSQPSVLTPTPTPTPTPTLPGATLSEQQARSELQQAGITVNKGACPVGVSYQNVSGGCTSLGGIKESTIEEVIRLKNESGAPVILTAGIETGHAEGTVSHSNGDKVDIGLNTSLNQYIQNNFTPIGVRSDGTQQYRAPDGTIYAREGDHWDVTVISL